MSTYDGAYSVRKFPTSHSSSEKTKIRYEIVDGKQIDVQHYHGSSFEYTWELTIKTPSGDIIKKELDTWREYNSLKGKTIEFDGTVFKVI